jgi:hypothetical protein
MRHALDIEHRDNDSMVIRQLLQRFVQFYL